MWCRVRSPSWAAVGKIAGNAASASQVSPADGSPGPAEYTGIPTAREFNMTGYPVERSSDLSPFPLFTADERRLSRLLPYGLYGRYCDLACMLRMYWAGSKINMIAGSVMRFMASTTVRDAEDAAPAISQSDTWAESSMTDRQSNG